MIYVGFPCIGKSYIAGGKNIDLESSNMFISDSRPEGWEKIYMKTNDFFGDIAIGEDAKC